MMARAEFLLGSALLAVVLAACGPANPADVARKKLAKAEAEARDPYRALQADQINAILYPGSKPAKMMEQLTLLGVGPGKDFADFKEESKIDDWFAAADTPENNSGPVRYISLTCGLSPVVNEAGKMMKFYRSRKNIDGKLREEMFIGPGKE
ncbi:hypothetical protein [Haloferula sp. BvORR071]|uniref:hypothetical protein n=1 Tax=Haloferula sp. BvORR071 TaxID=1396141 RepID=UPI00054E2DFA|nr:hypothetical protein [Haloferula sp. BvORR071]